MCTWVQLSSEAGVVGFTHVMGAENQTQTDPLQRLHKRLTLKPSLQPPEKVLMFQRVRRFRVAWWHLAFQPEM